MDRAYFEAYCGRGRYDEIWRSHSRVDHCVGLARRWQLGISSVCVLGAATGPVLLEFERGLGCRPSGCEISRWAHARIPRRLRQRIARADLRAYVPRLAREGARFDLVFSNALIYLEPSEITAVLADAARIGRYFHFWSSTREDCEPYDPYRRTLRTRRWWRTRFERAGFSATRSPFFWRSRRYVA